MPLYLLLFLLFSCADKQENDLSIPSNLMVEVSLDPEGSGYVHILASADNAVEYQLRIEAAGVMETNFTGVFEHTFIQPGTYLIDVRAYGVSERYLRNETSLTVVLGGGSIPVDLGYFSPLSYEGYDLVWHDEFDGSQINPEYWVFETGDGCPHLCGWGNNELQYYRPQNAWVSEGVLTIEAKRENASNRNYTSARMKTQGKKSIQYGRIDIRALLPKGQGIWPALWMLGNNISTVGWPYCGEIDIMEMIGGGNGRDNRVHGTLHWNNNGHAMAGGSYTKPAGIFADAYHVFSIIWDENTIRWFVNDTQFHQINIAPSHMQAFHQEFFLLFNVAVGGNWPGSPDATTIFPQKMKVDYIRVFQEK